MGELGRDGWDMCGWEACVDKWSEGNLILQELVEISHTLAEHEAPGFENLQ